MDPVLFGAPSLNSQELCGTETSAALSHRAGASQRELNAWVLEQAKKQALSTGSTHLWSRFGGATNARPTTTRGLSQVRAVPRHVLVPAMSCPLQTYSWVRRTPKPTGRQCRCSNRHLLAVTLTPPPLAPFLVGQYTPDN